MIVQQSAQIFKSYMNEVKRSNGYRCQSTLVFGDGSIEKQKSFGILKVLNDEVLASGKRKLYVVEENRLIILMPLVGMLEVGTSMEYGGRVLLPEEIRICSLRKGQSFFVSNPSEKGLANFLQIQLTVEGFSGTISFSGYQNNLLNVVLETEEYRVMFGVFDGRKEVEYYLKNPGNGIFAFIINGAFELENRLLENRDGLAIWNTDIIELEALSENAILLLMEIKIDVLPYLGTGHN